MPLCVICNKETGCNCKTGWRNICCSYEHYEQFLNKYEGVSGKVPYKLRVSDGTLIWNIKDYIINNNDIDLITTLEGKHLKLSETDYLIILNDEKKHLLKSFEDNGEYIRIDKQDYYEKLNLVSQPDNNEDEKYASESVLNAANEAADDVLNAVESVPETKKTRRSKYSS